MHIRGFESNKGTIKGPKNMRGKFCLQPFTNVDIHSNHGIRCCSESWMPSWIGDFSVNSIKEVWNSEKIQAIRNSILEGNYSYCDWHQCPFYCNDSYYLYTADELRNPDILNPVRALKVKKHAPWIHYILEGKTEMDLMPANYNLAYDESCNLVCPSCRTVTYYYNSGPEYERRLKLHNKLLNEVIKNGLEHIGRFNITGAGEPFVSKIFTDFLFNFEGKKHPNLDINLQSNGVLFTETVWNKMKKIHTNINEIIISLDASNPETYKQIRVNSSFEKLLNNIGFLMERRKEGKIKRLMLAFVVQRKNYQEMIDAVKIGKNIGVDLFIFNLLNDWKSWQPDVYENHAVWKKYHPDFNKFLAVLQDPIFDDPIVDLGNMSEYRLLAKEKFLVTA